MPRRGLVAGPDFEYFQRRFFTPVEVAQHNQPEDLWVSYLGYVYDLTPLAQEYKGKNHTLGQFWRMCWGCLVLVRLALTVAAPSQEIYY